MVEMHGLPRFLPQDADANREWKVQEEGLGAALSRAFGPRGLTRAKVAKDIAGRLSALGIWPSRDGESIAERTIENYLRLLASGERGLRMEELGRLIIGAGLQTTEFAQYATPPAPLSVFRPSFVSHRGPEKQAIQGVVRPLLGNDWDVIRASPPGSRLVDIYARHARRGVRSRGDNTWYCSPGCSYLVIIDGSVRASFYGLGVTDLHAGDMVYYDGSHPHRFDPSGDGEVFAYDISSNASGVGRELFLTQFDCRVSEEDIASAPPGADSHSRVRKFDHCVRANVAMALHSALISVDSLLRFSNGINAKRGQELKSAQGESPSSDEIQELAYLLRLPPRVFFGYFDEERRRSVLRVWRDQQINKEFQEEGERPARDLHSYYANGDWKRRTLFSLDEPFGYLTQQSGLGLFTFTVNGPSQADSKMVYHHYVSDSQAWDSEDPSQLQDPGEEVLLVRRGILGVDFQLPGTPNRCEAALGTGELVWYSTALRHAQYRPDGEESPAQSLYFWCPYPVMNRRHIAP